MNGQAASDNPTIYHITHASNLPGILAENGLWSDGQRIERGLVTTRIGYEHIKARRMRCPVSVAAGGMLGHYVPFYFCPRSVMLHSIWRGDVDGYEGGQRNVLHLVSDVRTALQLDRPYAYTNMHAELGYADFFVEPEHLGSLPWNIINSNSWGGDERRPFKQAEFLVHDFFPWVAVKTIGVHNQEVKTQVEQIISSDSHQPDVQIMPD